MPRVRHGGARQAAHDLNGSARQAGRPSRERSPQTCAFPIDFARVSRQSLPPSHEPDTVEMSRFAPSRRSVPRMLVACIVSALAATTWAKPRVLGWLEWAWLEPGHIRLKAKLDTGAKTSSIDADQITLFERDDEQWVRFRVPLSRRPDDTTHAEDVFYELPLAGRKKIKDHVLEPAKRYVVEMALCIGGRTFTTPVTLADRSRFNYPLLLGRVALQGRMMVDPAQKYTADRTCARPKKAPAPKTGDDTP